MQTEHIYALVDPGTRRVRYVGRTSLPLTKRLAQHIGAANRGDGSNSLHAWIRSICYEPIIVLLDTVEVHERSLAGGKYENTASSAEVKWIKRFERGSLVNAWVDRECQAYKRLINK